MRFLRRFYPLAAFFGGFIADALTLGQRVTPLDFWRLGGFLLGAAVFATCPRRSAADGRATGEDACRDAAEAFRRRFVSGGAGLDEHQTLSDLPSIPPSFKEPADGVAPAFPAEPEGTP